jgi:mannosyltransferase
VSLRAAILDIRFVAIPKIRIQVWFWSALISIILFGLLNTSFLLNKSLEIDEPYTANMVHLSWPEMYNAFYDDNVTPLHYALLKIWVGVVGESEVALRFPSLIFYGLTILVAGLTGRQILGMRGGLIAAFLVSISTDMGHLHAASARPYALMSLIAASTSGVFFYLLGLLPGTQSKPRLWAVFILLNTLGLLTHQIYLFFMLGCLCAALLSGYRNVLLVLASHLAALVIFLAVWGAVLINGMNLPTVTWMSAPGLYEFASAIANLWGIPQLLLLVTFFALFLAFNFPAARVLAQSRLLWTGVVLLAVTFLLPFFMSQFKPIFNHARLPILLLPLASLIVALLIVRLEISPRFTGLLLMLLLVTSLWMTYQRFQKREPYSTRQSVQHLIRNAACDDTIVAGALSYAELRYYLRVMSAPACLKITPFPTEVAAHPGWLDIDAVLEKPQVMQAEIDAILQQANRWPGSNVWVFYGAENFDNITNVLKSQLDAQLQLRETLNLRGEFYSSVLRYTVKT